MLIKTINKSDKGQTLVEFALVLPVLLAVVFGIIQFGIILNAYVSITHAAREGVRLAAVSGKENEVQVINRTYDLAATTGFVELNKSDISVSYMPDIGEEYDEGQEPIVGDIVRVEVENAAVRIIVPFLGTFTGNSVSIASSATMRLEEGYRLSAQLPGTLYMDVEHVSFGTTGNHLDVTLRIYNAANSGESIQGVDINKAYVDIVGQDPEIGWYSSPQSDKTTDINGRATLRFQGFLQNPPTDAFHFIIKDGGLVKSGYAYLDGKNKDQDNIVFSFTLDDI